MARQILGLTLALAGAGLLTAAATMLSVPLGMAVGGGFMIYSARALGE